MQCGNSVMYQRIIEIETWGTQLSLSQGLLHIEAPGKTPVSVPITSCAVLILSTPAVRLSGAVLSSIAESGGLTVVCNSRWLPVASFLPHVGMHEQTRIVQKQASMPCTLKKRLWKELIVRKIQNQAEVLKSQKLDFHPLLELSKAVRSGDATNIEARAAAYYWQMLRLVPRRDRTAQNANLLLNYAYTILCASTARSLCASGLNLCLGIHHHNKYNPYCLASDMMEPYRFFAESAVLECVAAFRPSDKITSEEKKFIGNYFLTRRIRIESAWCALNTALRKSAYSLFENINKSANCLSLPRGSIRCG